MGKVLKNTQKTNWKNADKSFFQMTVDMFLNSLTNYDVIS